MAIENAKTLNVRIRNKYDSYENWAASSLVLEAGEIAIAHTTVDVKVDNGSVKHPALLMKVGDGEKTFANLPWMSAKAADVLAVCKDEDDLKNFINGVITDAGVATDEALKTLSNQVTTNKGNIETLQGEMDAVEAKAAANEAAIAALDLLVGDDSVADQIKTYVDNLNLGGTYAAKDHKHEIADVNGLEDRLIAAKKAGDDATAALGEYKTTNNAAIENINNAITAIKDSDTIDSFADVVTALAGKQATGDYATKAEAQAMADGKDAAIQAAHKAGTDAAAAAGQALIDAKAYTDSEMTRLVGDTKVATQIETYVNGLKLEENYDAKGAAAAAETAAKGHADELNTAMDGRMQAVEAKKHEHANKDILDGITAEKVAAWDIAEQNAKDHANGLNTTMDGRVAALEAKFGGGEGNVEAQIAAAVAAEAALREAADANLQGQIGTASAEGVAATGLHARIEELEELVGDDKVSEAIAAAVKVEKERAEGIEGGLETRLAAVEGDYLKGADKTELEGKIKSNADAIELLTNGVDSETVDGVNDLIKYVKDHGTEVTGIKADIKQNADDIDALEGRMDAAEDAIDTKAAQTDLEALDERVEAVEAELDTAETGLKARMTQAEADIVALEGLTGGKKVSDAIDEAIEAALKVEVDGVKVDKYALASALADAIARIAQNETDIGTLESTKANDADLAAIAKTGSTDNLVQGAMTLVFDCGGAGV